MATKQDLKRDWNYNPTGKGGFGDNPQNRSNGGWKKENTFHWNFNNFKAMTDKEFGEWSKKNPKSKRTVAQSLAYERVRRAKESLKEFEVVANRSEGMPRERLEITNELQIDDKQFNQLINIIRSRAEGADSEKGGDRQSD